jgi:peptide/nickel transport system permease protein
MRILKLVTYYFLGIIAILCISVVPQFISTMNVPDSPGYFNQLALLLGEFVKPGSWQYVIQSTSATAPMMKILWPAFIYSMQILLSALALGFIIALFLAIGAVFLPKPILESIKKVLNILESIPDLIFATLLQVLALTVLQKSGILLFNIASFDEKAYFAPIVTLAILPLVSMFKILLLMIEEEFLKDYVTFAKSKGISKFTILTKHVIKNIMPISFHHMKIIIWGTLSSQFIIERVFNVHGLTYFLLDGFTPITIAVTLMLLFTPFYFFFELVDLWLKEEPLHTYELRKTNRRVIWSDKYITESVKIFFNNMFFSLKHINIRKMNPLRPILSFLIIFSRHMKNWKFALGSLFFIITISYSVYYSVSTDNHVDQERLFYEDDGVTLVSAMPHAPPEPFLLGSDRRGFDLLDQIVIGAKYTLIFALLIALLRVMGGLLFGSIYAFYLKPRLQHLLGKMVDSIHFLPLSLVAYILLAPILMPTREGFAYSFNERILLEILILTVVVVPLTTVLLGKEIKRVLDYEFIASAKILGGGKFHLFWRHILPHLGPRLTILFGTQFIQTLLIFIHLGVFNFFFGGTKLSFDPFGGDPPSSITHEWSGLVGQIGRSAIRGGMYWFLWILVAFILAILAMQLIIQGVKEVQQVKVGVLYKVPITRLKKINTKTKNPTINQITKESFKEVGRGV